jgi:hypothetical protein
MRWKKWRSLIQTLVRFPQKGKEEGVKEGKILCVIDLWSILVNKDRLFPLINDNEGCFLRFNLFGKFQQKVEEVTEGGSISRNCTPALTLHTWH